MKVAVVMNHIENIAYYKDTTFALLLEAQKRDFALFYIESHQLNIQNGIPFANAQPLTVYDQAEQFAQLGECSRYELREFDIILMRQDPPVDALFLHNTHILSLAETQGCKVYNSPQAMRDFNEKLFGCHFSYLTPKTLVSLDKQTLLDFHKQYKDVVIKPLNGMGGMGILRLHENDPNASSAIELVGNYGAEYIMMQQFIPDIRNGDKRVILINGEPCEYCLARIPQQNELRANLATGGTGRTQKLSAKDYEIANTVGAYIRDIGLHLVGLDIIGDYLTEINVTSPTGIREISKDSQINIAKKVWQSMLAS